MKQIDVTPTEVYVWVMKDRLPLQINDGIPEIKPQDLLPYTKTVRLIDVRRPEEFTGELGHIEGAELITLGEDLTKHVSTWDRNEHIVFVCRSGGRSGQATRYCQELGFKNVANLIGGMVLWNELKHPIQK